MRSRPLLSWLAEEWPMLLAMLAAGAALWLYGDRR